MEEISINRRTLNSSNEEECKILFDLCKMFHTGFIEKYFPTDSPRDTFWDWKMALKEENSDLQSEKVLNPDMNIIILRLNGDIIGGIVTEYYWYSNCGLIAYLIIAESHRGRGYARRLFDLSCAYFRCLSMLRSDCLSELKDDDPVKHFLTTSLSMNSQGRFCIFAEVYKVKPQHCSIPVATRNRIMNKLGFKEIQGLDYQQPDCSVTTGNDESLALFVHVAHFNSSDSLDAVRGSSGFVGGREDLDMLLSYSSDPLVCSNSSLPSSTPPYCSTSPIIDRIRHSISTILKYFPRDCYLATINDPRAAIPTVWDCDLADDGNHCHDPNVQPATEGETLLRGVSIVPSVIILHFLLDLFSAFTGSTYMEVLHYDGIISMRAQLCGEFMRAAADSTTTTTTSTDTTDTGASTSGTRVSNTQTHNTHIPSDTHNHHHRNERVPSSISSYATELI
eukprot:Nk52_evm1s1712 gene=Nk52_evmTU1s1712